jgi:hypothetical protein
VALLNFWGTYEFIKEMRNRLHAHNELLMGNDAYFRRWCLAPWVDVPGREYTWVEKGKFVEVPDERYLFFRAMSYQRPYLMLMNNAFDDARAIEPYFQRNVFYAVYPSFFTAHAAMGERPYFDVPDWYNRDRALFKKYVPMIKKLDEAGWQPLPLAECDNDAIRFERYGDARSKNLAFTIHNISDQLVHMALKLKARELELPTRLKAKEWFTASDLAAQRIGDEQKIVFDMPPGGYGVIGVSD